MTRQITFEQAVKNDQTMPAAWKRYWLGICRRERHQRKLARREANLTKRDLQSEQDRKEGWMMNGDELTEKQAKVLQMHSEGKTWTEIGQALGMRPRNAQQAYNRAEIKVIRRKRLEARNA